VYPLALLILVAIACACRLHGRCRGICICQLLGEHTATFDGANGDDGAGLHVGWPGPRSRATARPSLAAIRSAANRVADPRSRGQDCRQDACWSKRTFCCGSRIGIAVDLFVRRIGTLERASALLEPRIRSELGTAIGQMQ